MSVIHSRGGDWKWWLLEGGWAGVSCPDMSVACSSYGAYCLHEGALNGACSGSLFVGLCWRELWIVAEGGAWKM